MVNGTRHIPCCRRIFQSRRTFTRHWIDRQRTDPAQRWRVCASCEDSTPLPQRLLWKRRERTIRSATKEPPIGHRTRPRSPKSSEKTDDNTMEAGCSSALNCSSTILSHRQTWQVVQRKRPSTIRRRNRPTEPTRHRRNSH
jgi:hypothetical protein